MTTVLVCGGRNYRDKRRLFAEMNALHAEVTIVHLIHGGAKGADTLAGEWGTSRRLDVKVYHADWERDGKAAGPLRNQRMLDEGRPDIVVAFPGGLGTTDMVSRAKLRGVEVIQIPSRYTTIQIDGPSFCAGLTARDGVVLTAAPYLARYIGWTGEMIALECKNRGWHWRQVPIEKGPVDTEPPIVA